jgi:hypothetical protein
MDQHHDPGFARLRTLLQTHTAAFDLIKEASFDYDERTLPYSAFAWPAKRLFPVHTEKQAALSWLYAKNDATVPAEVKHAVKEAVLVYGIPEDAFTPVQEKMASAEECLFPEENTYPVRTAEEVKYAEKRLIPQIPKMSPQRRADTFVRLYEKAAELNVELQPISLKYAGLTQTDPDLLVQMIKARAGATKIAELSRAYEGLASMIQRNPRSVQNRETQVKLASALDELDQHADLPKHYDRGIPDPIASVFNTTKKAEASIELAGKSCPISKLRMMPTSFYADVLGPDVVRDLAPGGQFLDQDSIVPIIESLPLDMKRNLAAALSL